MDGKVMPVGNVNVGRKGVLGNGSQSLGMKGVGEAGKQKGKGSRSCHRPQAQHQGCLGSFLNVCGQARVMKGDQRQVRWPEHKMRFPGNSTTIITSFL